MKFWMLPTVLLATLLLGLSTACAESQIAQVLLRNVTYSNVSDNPVASLRTVRITVSDGRGGTSVPKTRSIKVTPVNDVPVMSLPGGPAS